MKKKNRVLKYQEFQEILNNKNFINGNVFAVYYKKSDLNFERYGLLVTKKNGIAVIRNKIKRQVRMMIQNITDYSLSLNFIIVVKRNYDIGKYKENEQELIDIISSIRSSNEN